MTKLFRFGLMQHNYAIIDIETTGGIPGKDKITEIAIVIFDGNSIVDTFSSLINPERSIPYEITRITGITDDMVADAPRFYEVAKKVVELTENTIFVAHNVRFDYGFIQEEFRSLGYTFSRSHICTVVLSRKTFPGLRSYALGNLIRHFGISVNNRHRALDDALATTDILGRILIRQEHQVEQFVKTETKDGTLPQNISLQQIENLPEVTGVYYMINTYGHVIYVGKSINVRKRVMQHFTAHDLKRHKLESRVADIKCHPTGSELLALLKESVDIKTLQPDINKAQRSKNFPYFIYYYLDDKGYIQFKWAKSAQKSDNIKGILNHYISRNVVRNQLLRVTEKYTLCPGMAGIHDLQGTCFYYQTGSCLGACQQEESPESYNQRAQMAVENLKNSFDSTFFIITQGRTDEESGIILIAEGHYKGFGFISSENHTTGTEHWRDAIQYVPFNPECDRIIHTWLHKYPDTRVVPID